MSMFAPPTSAYHNAPVVSVTQDVTKDMRIKYPGTIELLMEAGASLTEIMELEEGKRKEILGNGFAVASLMKAKVSFTDITRLEEGKRKEIINKSIAVAKLVEEGVSLTDIKELEEGLLKYILQRFHGVLNLIKEKIATFTEIMELEPDLRKEIVDNGYCISTILRKLPCTSFRDFINKAQTERMSLIKAFYDTTRLQTSNDDLSLPRSVKFIY